MPALKATRQELFAQALANGETMSAAYEQAGYKPDPGNAHRLQNTDKVRQRIAELMAENQAIHAAGIAEAVSATAITKEWILDGLRQVVELGLAAGDLAPVNRAFELLGKATAPGMFAEHSVASVTTIDGDLERMTPAERQAEFGRLVREAEAQGVVVPLDGGADGGLAAKRRA